MLVIKNLFIKDKKHHEKGFKATRKNILLLSFAAVFIWAYNAAFVIGDWIIALLILTSFFNMKYHNAIFLLVVSMIFSQPFAVYEYYKNWLLNIDFLIPMIIATLIWWIIAWIILEGPLQKYQN